MPVPKHIVESAGEAWTDADRIVTNGAFLLSAMEPGEKITLKRNPNYHGVVDGNVEVVEVFIYKEHGGEPLKWYADHLIDYVNFYWLPPEEADRARHQYADDYLTIPYFAELFLCFNTSRPPFSDGRVRKALALAIDREALAEIAFRGQLSPATGGFVPPGVPGHLAKTAPAFDPDRARSLLKEAGYSEFGGIECVAPPFSAHKVLVEQIRSQWSDHLGIDTEWQHLEMPRFLELISGQIPDVYTNAWTADYPDPDNFLRIAPVEVLDVWDHPRYFELVENARRSINQEERMQMYTEAQQILIDEVPIFPLTYNRGHALLKPWISQYPLSPMITNDWKNVIIDEQE